MSNRNDQEKTLVTKALLKFDITTAVAMKHKDLLPNTDELKKSFVPFTLRINFPDSLLVKFS